MKKLLLLLFLLPLCLTACASDYQTPVDTSSLVSANNVVSSTETVKPLVKVKAQAQVITPGLSNDNHYVKSAGNLVHSPAYAPRIPAGASARCGDGTYSFSQSRRGTCSHHGGVREWLN